MHLRLHKSIYLKLVYLFINLVRAKGARRVKVSSKRAVSDLQVAFCGKTCVAWQIVHVFGMPKVAFLALFCLEGCIVAWRGVLKNAFPLAYKVEKM